MCGRKGRRKDDENTGKTNYKNKIELDEVGQRVHTLRESLSYVPTQFVFFLTHAY